MAPQLATNLWSVLGNGTGIGGGDANTTGQDLNTALAFAKRFDPNASIGWTPEGNQYVNFNNALLPQNVTGGHGIEGIARMPGSGERMLNPNAVFNDPTFGQVTLPQNLAEKGPSLVDIIGPLVVGGAAGLGAGGFSAISSLMQKAPQLGGMLTSLFGGGGQSSPNFSPGQIMLLRLLAAQQQSGGG